MGVVVDLTVPTNPRAVSITELVTSSPYGVRSVFESAGVVVINFAEKLGGTKNANLLCILNERSRLAK